MITAAMVGGHEVMPDRQRERERAAGLNLVLVAADRAEQQAQVGHPLVVYAPQALGDRRVMPGPGADCQVDRQQPGGEGERARAPYPGPGVAALPLDAFGYLIGAHPLPGIEHLIEQRVPVGEVPVEAAFGHAERLRQRLHPDGVWAARRQRPQTLLDPPAARCPDDPGHGSHLYFSCLDSIAPNASVHIYATVYMANGSPQGCSEGEP